MYTVGRDMLPEADRTAEAVEIMVETLAEIEELPLCSGLNFTGEVLQDMSDPDRFQVAGYSGRITTVSTVEPPTFNLLVDDAWQQVAKCDCPAGDIDIVFEDFGQAMAETELSLELDEFAGTPTQDPHYEPRSEEIGREITIRFDRLGWYGCSGALNSIVTD